MRGFRSRAILLACLFLICGVSFALATDRYVDAATGNNSNDGSSENPWMTITHALTQVSSGDRINVRRGTYDTDLGESFPLQMKSGVDLVAVTPGWFTVIHGDGSNRVITCDQVTGVTIYGFVVENGNAGNDDGGGIYCDESHQITIKKCVIQNNTATNGGGISTYYSSVTIHDNLIQSNTATYNGGGIYIKEPDDGDGNAGTIAHIIEKNCVYDNYAGGAGGGICFYSDHDKSDLFNNLVIKNRLPGNSNSAGGVELCECAQVLVYNNTIADNDGYGLKVNGDECNVEAGNNIICENALCPNVTPDGLNIRYSDIQMDSNYTGSAYDGTDKHNINQNPKFDSPSEAAPCEHYFLKQKDDPPSSPCVDAGNYTLHRADELINTDHYSTDVGGDQDESNGTSTNVDMGFHYQKYGASFIELMSFTAQARKDSIVLTWVTGTEIDNSGFLIYRCDNPTAGCHKVGGFIQAKGNAASGASYTFVDRDVVRGVRYYYWLVDIDSKGRWTAHGPVEAAVPVRLELVPAPVNRGLVATK